MLDEHLNKSFEEETTRLKGRFKVNSKHELEIALGASDLEARMRNWLSELNFAHLTEGFLLSSASVRRISETELEATVRGEPINLERHPIHTEIKAVTYHEMIVEKRNDRWYGRIIFDI